MSLARHLQVPVRELPRAWRSPASLYLTLWGLRWCRPGFARTWRSLVHGMSISEAVARVRDAKERAGSFPAVVSWNARWLRSIHNPTGVSKRNVVQRWVERGLFVLLQETHWDDAAADIWASSLTPSKWVWAEATRGPRGGPSGGVAIGVPKGWSVVSSDADKEGAWVMAMVRPAGVGTEVCRVVSLYLAPGRRRADLDRFAAKSRTWDPEVPTVLAGD